MVEQRVGGEDPIGIHLDPSADSVEPAVSQLITMRAHPLSQGCGEGAIFKGNIRISGQQFGNSTHSTFLKKHGYNHA